MYNLQDNKLCEQKEESTTKVVIQFGGRLFAIQKTQPMGGFFHTTLKGVTTAPLSFI